MATIKHQRANSFYDRFDRKPTNQDVSHYCPGCGHGTVHNFIAEAIDDMQIQDKVIFVAPVGCSVFTYYYFDVCNVQAAHGRAPAVATALCRTHKDSIVISYQGDGDLAGIGMGNIVHAANRGENITVFFVNNAIYGMTGGQMAPTTLIGQKTTTTPMGRSAHNEGNPIGMCEMLSTLKAPIYVERVSLGDGKRVLKARKAIRKALQNQIDKKGFSFVEILSPCPINWKKTPLEARNWLKECLEPQFPVKNFVDKDVEPGSGVAKNVPVTPEEIINLFNVSKEEIAVKNNKIIPTQLVKIAGFGGQGVMSAGILLANCAIAEGLKSSWLPSYGPEMRGGTANASINISQDMIGSPIVDYPNVLIAMNAPSLYSFEDKVATDGLIMVNSSLISDKVKRNDVKTIYIPATDMAKELGTLQVANVIVLTVYALISGVFSVDTLRKIIPASLKRKNLADVNLQAVELGVKFYQENCK